MADIRIKDLPLATGGTAPSVTDAIAIDGLTTRRTTITALGDVAVPIASQAEAEAGVNASKRMTPLTVKQSIASEVGVTLASAAQGVLADGAVQAYFSVAAVAAKTISSNIGRVRTEFNAPVVASQVTLVGGAYYRRISFADLTNYPSQSYFRTVDRFMPDGTTDPTNGGYWLLDEQEPSLFHMGAIADFNGTTGTDCLPAYNALLKFAILTGRKGIIPAGSFYANGAAATPIAGSLRIEGVDWQSRIYVNATGVWQTIVQTDPFATTVFDGIILVAWNQTQPTAQAMDIQYPSVASFTFSQVKLNVRALSDSGVVSSPWQRTWFSGFSLKNVWYADLRMSVFVGKPDITVGGNPVGRTDGSFAVRVYGGAYSSVGLYLEKFIGFYAHHGLLCDGYTEAPRLTGTEFVGVRKGVTVPASTPLGGAGLAFRGESFWFTDFHAAAFECGVDLDTVQHSYGDINVHRAAGSTVTAWSGMRLNSCRNAADLSVSAQGNNGTGTATGLVATGGGGHQISLVTENVNIDFNVTADTTVLSGKNVSGSATARDNSTFSGSNSSLLWSRVDGGYEINGILLSKALAGVPTIAPYDAAVTDASLSLSAKGAGEVSFRNNLGTGIIGMARQGQASPAEYVTMLAYAVGNGAELSADGAAANINLRVRPKAAGQLLMEWLLSRSYANDAAAAATTVVGGVYLNSTTGAISVRRT